ncbi:MAG: GAF domain-containing protein [Acidimicrobiales bacterium]
MAVWEYDYRTNTMDRSANHDALYGLDWQVPWRIETFLAATHPEDRPAAAAIDAAVAPGGPDEYEYDFRVVDPAERVRWLWVRGRVVERDATGRGQRVRGTLIDVTERHRLEHHLAHVNRLYATLSECNQAVIRSADEDELFRRICTAAVRVGSRAAWVASVEPRGLRVVAHAGEGMRAFLSERADLLAHAPGTAVDLPAEAVTTGRVAVRQIGVTGLDALATACLRQGWRSAVSLPLTRGGEVVAALTLYAAEGDFFDESVDALLAEMASDVSFALDRFAALRAHERVEQQRQPAEARWRALVDQEVVAMVAFADGRVVEANARAATLLGYATAADLVAADPAGGSWLAETGGAGEVRRGTITGDGVPRAVRYVATPVGSGGGGEVVAVLAEADPAR